MSSADNDVYQDNIWRNYRPSNGTEGEYFARQTCYRCAHDHQWHSPDMDGDYTCPILMSSIVGEYSYPNELGPPQWTYNPDTGEGWCSAFDGPCACEDHGGDDEPKPKSFDPGPDHGRLFEVIDQTATTPMLIIQTEEPARV